MDDLLTNISPDIPSHSRSDRVIWIPDESKGYTVKSFMTVAVSKNS